MISIRKRSGRNLARVFIIHLQLVLSSLWYYDVFLKLDTTITWPESKTVYCFCLLLNPLWFMFAFDYGKHISMHQKPMGSSLQSLLPLSSLSSPFTIIIILIISWSKTKKKPWSNTYRVQLMSYVWQGTQQQRPESLAITITQHASITQGR